MHWKFNISWKGRIQIRGLDLDSTTLGKHKNAIGYSNGLLGRLAGALRFSFQKKLAFIYSVYENYN